MVHFSKVILIIAGIAFHGNLLAQLESFKTSIKRSEEINFILYTPHLGQAPYPLVVFLHGGEESGDDISLLTRHGIPLLLAQGKSFPFYVFAPQNPDKHALWDDRMVDAMVDDLLDSLNIDARRIYLVGMSRGGYGAWRIAINNPEKYAAMISISSAAIPLVYLNWTPTLPVWFFHGEKDSIVPVEQTTHAYEKLKKENARVKLTVHPNAGHDNWALTFENDEIYNWLLSHHLK